jgi:hypothetical protein
LDAKGKNNIFMQTEQKLIEQERVNRNRRLGRSLRAITLHQEMNRSITKSLEIDGLVESGALTAAGEAKLAELRRCLI